MAITSAGNRLSLICFFLACFSLPVRAETFAGCAEAKAYSIPLVEVQAVDIQVPPVLLTQLESERKKNLAEKKQINQAPASHQEARNLFPIFKLVRSVQPTTMEEKMADNTNQGSKDWDKQGQKKPDQNQKKPDMNQDADQDSESE